MDNSFIDPTLRGDFAHYVVRKSILQSIRKYLPEFRGKVVDLGCGDMPYKEMILSQKRVTDYISIDWPGTKYYHNQPNFFWDGITIPLENESVDCVLLTEVIEHLDNPTAVLKEIRRILRPGGIVTGTTPFIWPLHEVPNDMHRLSPFGVKRIMADAGYTSYEVTGMGGWRTAFAQFMSAYIAFGIKNSLVRKIAKAVFYFPIYFFSDNDKEVTEFGHATMVSSVSFKAIK